MKQNVYTLLTGTAAAKYNLTVETLSRGYSLSKGGPPVNMRNHKSEHKLYA